MASDVARSRRWIEPIAQGTRRAESGALEVLSDAARRRARDGTRGLGAPLPGTTHADRHARRSASDERVPAAGQRAKSGMNRAVPFGAVLRRTFAYIAGGRPVNPLDAGPRPRSISVPRAALYRRSAAVTGPSVVALLHHLQLQSLDAARLYLRCAVAPCDERRSSLVPARRVNSTVAGLISRCADVSRHTPASVGHCPGLSYSDLVLLGHCPGFWLVRARQAWPSLLIST